MDNMMQENVEKNEKTLFRMWGNLNLWGSDVFGRTVGTRPKSGGHATPPPLIYYYARRQPDIYKTVIYTLHSCTKVKNIKNTQK